MNLFELLSTFKSEADFHVFLTKRRWSNGVRCSFCQSNHISNRKSSNRYKCHDCNRSFSVTSGTIMHATKLPLSKWFLAISIIANAKKGLSSLQLSRDLGVNKNTAWYLQMRIRTAMEDDPTLGGLLEPLRFRSRSNRPRVFSEKVFENPSYHLIQRKSLVIIGKEDRKKEMITMSVKSSIQPSRTDIILTRALTGQYHRLNLGYLIHYLKEIEIKSSYEPKQLFNLVLSRCSGVCAIR